MTIKWKIFILSALLLQDFNQGFKLIEDPDCYGIDNEILSIEENCQWKNLSKYRHFYAILLLDENPKFAVELQELYNIVSSALAERDMLEKERLKKYSQWLIEKTKDLKIYLESRGLNDI
ncbi:uncharacterized protein LOC119688158 [Teleopsis dalmanni]|uniref:uncharacterized protein LOC119688158 n=1 Tax=Teleopsis dalmanni TaxID=139649 RepID=UPI0018CEC2E0|nr:uncharacterized protein LOC119688158 [Teleopsis dalmanni]